MSKSGYYGSVMKGVGVAGGETFATICAGVFLAAALPSSASDILALAAVGIGVTQVFWVVPTVIYFRKRQEPETVKGVLIAAGIVAMLNAACWGAVLTLFQIR